MTTRLTQFLIPYLASMALILGFSNSARSDWNDASRQWASDLLEKPVLFPHAHMAEVYTADRDNYVRDAHIYMHTVPDDRFEDGGFKIALQTKRNFWGQTNVAPLMLYLPGLFSNMEDHASMRAEAFFSERGYHVVVPSNPWSVEFLKHHPKFDPGSLEDEAEVALAALDYAIQALGPEHISRIEISGESYGAMLAAIAYTKDHQRAKPLIDGPATLFSPPIDMNAAIDNLDKGIDANLETFQTSCSGASFLLKVDNECEHHKSEDGMDQAVIDCSGPMVFNGFHGGLVAAVEEFHSYRPTSGDIPTDDAAKAKWENDLRFRTLVTTYTPGTQKILAAGEGTLVYWFNQLDQTSMSNVRIFTAQDDFLNDGVIWPIDTSVIHSENFLQVNWGGHTGYSQTDDFQHLLNTSFKASEQ